MLEDIIKNFCAVVGCGNRADRNRDISFVSLPAVATVKGEKFRKLMERRERRGSLLSTENRPETDQFEVHTRLFRSLRKCKTFCNGRRNEFGLDSESKTVIYYCGLVVPYFLRFILFGGVLF